MDTKNKVQNETKWKKALKNKEKGTIMQLFLKKRRKKMKRAGEWQSEKRKKKRKKKRE
jgi:hypothetical protein